MSNRQNTVQGEIMRKHALEMAQRVTESKGVNEEVIANYFGYCTGTIGINKTLWFFHDGEWWDVALTITKRQDESHGKE